MSAFVKPKVQNTRHVLDRINMHQINTTQTEIKEESEKFDFFQYNAGRLDSLRRLSKIPTNQM